MYDPHFLAKGLKPMRLLPCVLRYNLILVGEPHRLNSVFPTDHSWSLLLIFRNDPLGLLGRPGYPPVDHGF